MHIKRDRRCLLLVVVQQMRRKARHDMQEQKLKLALHRHTDTQSPGPRPSSFHHHLIVIMIVKGLPGLNDFQVGHTQRTGIKESFAGSWMALPFRLIISLRNRAYAYVFMVAANYCQLSKLIDIIAFFALQRWCPSEEVYLPFLYFFSVPNNN